MINDPYNYEINLFPVESVDYFPQVFVEFGLPFYVGAKMEN